MEHDFRVPARNLGSKDVRNHACLLRSASRQRKASASFAVHVVRLAHQLVCDFDQLRAIQRIARELPVRPKNAVGFLHRLLEAWDVLKRLNRPVSIERR